MTATGQPAIGGTIGLAQTEHTGIFRVGLVVGNTILGRLVVVEVPTYDVVGCREGCRHVLFTVHQNGALGIGRVVFPASEGQNAVVQCRQLYLCSLFIVVCTVDIVAYR